MNKIFFIFKMDFWQLSSYFFYGILSLIIDTFIFWFFTEILHINYLYSNATAWIISFLFTFFTNKFCIFHSKDININLFIKEFMTFLSCRISTLFLGMGLIYFCVDIFAFNKLYSKIFTNIITIGINYIVSKYFIFNSEFKEQEGNK